MATEQQGKKVKVVQTLKLEPGMEATLHDFQISASASDGTITMVDMQLVNDEPEQFVDYKLVPGCWRLTPKSGMQKLEVGPETYIETDISAKLTKHFTTFFAKLDVYEKNKLPPNRKILLGSEQGMGKSSCIREFIRSVKDDPEMCILRIDTVEVSWEVITQMFMKAKKEDVGKIVLIIEDIGGTALDERRHGVQPDLLNFLSGNSDIFKVPTLVIGTTNFLNEIGAVLNDRPGRFDVVLQLPALSDKDTTTIVESILERALGDEEKKALLSKGFTPAYCLEAILRSELYEISMEEATNELIAQRKKSKDRTHGSRDKGDDFGFGGR